MFPLITAAKMLVVKEDLTLESARTILFASLNVKQIYIRLVTNF
jgi:hypothetical protein